MTQTTTRIAKILLVLLLALIPFILPETGSAAQDMGGIRFTNTHVESDFPHSLTFSITAESSQGDITSGRLHYAIGEDASVTLQNMEIDPVPKADLSYMWDTSSITIPPSSPIIFHWEVTDSNGNRVSSPEEVFYYDDVRFDWQILQDDFLAVWTHDRESSFGQQIFDIARKSFQQQRAMFGQDPEQQIKVIVYNDFDEFEEWHSFIGEWVGGQAFPNIGVTTQIVSAYSSLDSWLNNVIPHEIAHLYFYQATDHAYVTPPAWLNEGLAQLTEVTSNAQALEFAKAEISQGNLLPLWSLTGSFGNDEYQVALAYIEALSVATFIQEIYGNEGISALLEAYRSGLADDEALFQGLGVSLLELQRGWLEWMGVDPDMYPAPTAEPTIAWPTPPSYSTSPPKPSPTPSAIASPLPPPTVAAHTPIPTEESRTEPLNRPTENPVQAGGQSDAGTERETSPFNNCGTAFIPFFGFLVVFFLLRRLGR